jgi:hypothetical protein
MSLEIAPPSFSNHSRYGTLHPARAMAGCRRWTSAAEGLPPSALTSRLVQSKRAAIGASKIRLPPSEPMMGTTHDGCLGATVEAASVTAGTPKASSDKAPANTWLCSEGGRDQGHGGRAARRQRKAITDCNANGRVRARPTRQPLLREATGGPRRPSNLGAVRTGGRRGGPISQSREMRARTLNVAGHTIGLDKREPLTRSDGSIFGRPTASITSS